MECTFRIKDIMRLMKSNPNAKNVIVKFEKGAKKEFTGRLQHQSEATEEIEGCPYPPGCNDDGEEEGAG